MYRFIYQNGKFESLADRRRMQLQDSDARSHAARVSHLNKTRKHPPSGLVTKHTATISPGELTELGATETQASFEGKDDRQGRRLVHNRSKGPKYPHHSYALTKSNRDLPDMNVPPWSILAQSTRDPFDSYPGRKLPEHVEWAVNYMVEGIWPQMLSAVPRASLVVARRDWRRYCLDDDLLFHCQVALACGLSLASQKNYSTPRALEALTLARFHHYSIALRLLKQQIESLDGRPASELLIICVLRMGVSADVEQDPIPPDCHPSSPLATAQYLHLYGRMSMMPSYAKALHYLVESRGGIHALKRIAVPDWLILADIYSASRTGDPLRYPRIRPCESIVSSGKHVPDAKARDLSEQLGSGFRGLGDVLTFEIREAVRKAVEATVALDHYDRHENNPPFLAHVVLAANEAQRAVLELSVNDGSRTAQLVCSCYRIAALIYNDMVLFPLPSCTRLKSRLAQELKRLLEELEKSEATSEEATGSNTSLLADMLVWVTVMGGIAASFTPNRRWFADRLRSRLTGSAQAEARNHKWTWLDFERLVSSFLWWNPVVDATAANLWKEATEVDVADKTTDDE